jgi:hypothetical protein
MGETFRERDKSYINAKESYKASNGTFLIHGSASVERDFVGFKVDSNAVISAIEIDGVDVTDDYILGGGTELPQGVIIHQVPNLRPFTKIVIDSGFVTLILN